jgi:hypothetical protein
VLEQKEVAACRTDRHLSISLNGAACLANVALTRTRRTRLGSFFTDRRKLGTYVGQSHRVAVPRLKPAYVTDSCADSGKSGHRDGFLRDRVDTLQSTGSTSDLPVALAVLLESGPEKLLLITQAFAVSKISGPVHHREHYSLFLEQCCWQFELRQTLVYVVPRCTSWLSEPIQTFNSSLFKASHTFFFLIKRWSGPATSYRGA